LIDKGDITGALAATISDGRLSGGRADRDCRVDLIWLMTGRHINSYSTKFQRTNTRKNVVDVLHSNAANIWLSVISKLNVT